MYCHKCGTQIDEGAVFCHGCGEKVIYEGSQEDEKSEPIDENGFLPENNPAEEKEKSEFDEWWESSSKAKRGLVIITAVIVLIIIIAVVWKFRSIIAVVLLAVGVIGALTMGTKEEKAEARRDMVKILVGIGIFTAIILIIVLRPDFISNVIQPGAEVRNAYLSQYSEDVTVEDALEEYFDNGKWDTYKEGGYSYVTFTGTCNYLGEKTDAKITFKITGENFIVDSLDLNGREQNDLILVLFLTEVYEDY